MALILTDQAGNQYALTVNEADGSLVTTPVKAAGATTDNSVTTSAWKLIKGALRLLGVIDPGEGPTSDEANDSLEALQQMIDSWNAERLTVYSTAAQDFPLTLGKQAYTMGPGGDFDVNRPARISAMSAILLDNAANPVEIPMALYTTKDWQTKVPVKAVDSNFPQLCYDDGGMPLRTLNFWPIPVFGANAVRIYSWLPLLWPATLQTTMNFPPGYVEAFKYNLAIRLAGEFTVQPAEQVIEIAIDTLAKVKAMNVQDLSLASDLLPQQGGYNYRADLFGIGF